MASAREQVASWFRPNPDPIAPAPFVRLAFLFLPCYMTYASAERRGWWFAIVTAALFGPSFILMALRPGAQATWSYNHPRLQRLLWGPLVVFGIGFLTSVSAWWCLAGGVAGLILGAAMGERRVRQLREGPETLE